MEIHKLSTARVGVPHNVTAIADGRHCARLYELGMGEGTEVTVVKRGDPAILTVGSGTFAMARELLELVTVSCESKAKPR